MSLTATFDTDRGPIKVELAADKAPLTVANFVNLAKRGFYYLLGLRLAGAPHVLVTASSALSAIRTRSFITATLLGFLPAIALAAMAGSAV